MSDNESLYSTSAGVCWMLLPLPPPPLLERGAAAACHRRCRPAGGGLDECSGALVIGVVRVVTLGAAGWRSTGKLDIIMVHWQGCPGVGVLEDM